MRQFIGFKLNQNEFTIPILKVREIINTPEVTQLPQAPHYMKGIVNIRGMIIPVVDLKKIIKSDKTASGEEIGGKVIVITNRNATFGILVDSITSVINIDESDIEAPEGFMSDLNLESVEGVAKFDDRLIILLDTDKLVAQNEIEIMDADPAGIAKETTEDVRQIPTDTATATSTTPPTPAAPVTPPTPAAVRPAEAPIKATQQVRQVKEALSMKFSDNESKNNFLLKLVKLIETMASKDFNTADTMISELLQHTEGDLYNRIGQVTRKLHNSLKEFRSALDPRIKQIANEDVPQAVDRLEYVIAKSEEAAHRTMGVVEKYQLNMPEFEAHVGNVTAPDESKEFLRAFSVSLKDDLNKIMLAQEFQDITGQTIHRVIDLVNTIEAELIGLITTFGEREGAEAPAPETRQSAEKVTQTEVEDLLKEFGF